MLILAMESSAKPASVAICQDDTLLGQYFQNSSLTHSKTLMVMTESLLENLAIELSEIDLFAVSKGPGSFTGVRIGVSAIKGLAWGIGKPVCGVSTLEAMAFQLPDMSGIICAVMDARRDQVYNALFEWEDGALKRLTEDRAISLEELSSELQNLNRNFILVGDGFKVSNDFFHKSDLSNKIDYKPAPPLLRFQTAYGVVLAALKTPPSDSLSLEPNYLRPSQAERSLSKPNT